MGCARTGWVAFDPWAHPRGLEAWKAAPVRRAFSPWPQGAGARNARGVTRQAPKPSGFGPGASPLTSQGWPWQLVGRRALWIPRQRLAAPFRHAGVQQQSCQWCRGALQDGRTLGVYRTRVHRGWTPRGGRGQSGATPGRDQGASTGRSDAERRSGCPGIGGLSQAWLRRRSARLPLQSSRVTSTHPPSGSHWPSSGVRSRKPL